MDREFLKDLLLTPSVSGYEEANQKKDSGLKATAQDLAEEAAILSTMTENIAIANRNQVKQPEVKTIERQDGIKKIDTIQKTWYCK